MKGGNKDLEKKYGVWAVRSAASMFGAAQAWCKDNGRPIQFDTMAQADAYAKELNSTLRTGNVHYYAKEMEIRQKTASTPQSVEERENYLRNAELYEEGQTGNYNMIDGLIDNEPPACPDLMDGQHKEEIKEPSSDTEKPSVVGRLKTSQTGYEARRTVPDPPEREL